MRRWMGLALIVISVIAVGCTGNAPSTIPYEDLPATGDATRGEALFNDTTRGVPPCSGCHIPEVAAAPSLVDYNAEVAASRVEGQDAREYTFYAITEPAQYIVEGFGNAMYNKYDEHFSPQDIADLIAYLLNE